MEKKYLALSIHTLASLPILVLYFQVAAESDFSYLEQAGPGDLLKFLVLFVLFYLNLLGSFFFWPTGFTGSLLCAVLGLLIALAALGLIRAHGRQLTENPQRLFWTSGLLLLLLMMALISAGRFGTPGSDRYVFYADFAVIFLVSLFLSGTLPSRRTLLILALLCLAHYPLQLALKLPYIERIRGEIVHCNQRWYQEGLACGVMMNHEEATTLLREAERQGILHLPPPPDL